MSEKPRRLSREVGVLDAALAQILKNGRTHFWTLLASMVAVAVFSGALIEVGTAFFRQPSWGMSLWLLACLLGLVASGGLPLRLEVRERELRAEAEAARRVRQRSIEDIVEQVREEYRYDTAELLGFIEGFVGPALEHLPGLVGLDRGRREVSLKTLTNTILNGASSVCGPHDSGVRAIWFEACGRKLKPAGWSGGTSQTKQEFVNHNSNLAGKTTWELARTGEPKLWADLDRDSPPGYRASPASRYKTYITCGVLNADGEVLGMFNVDAPHAGDLTEIDVRIVRICSRILGAAFQVERSHGTVGATPMREGLDDQEEREATDDDGNGRQSSVA